MKAQAEILSTIKYYHPGKRLEIASAIAALAGPLPQNLMMTNEQVRGLHHAGIEIGGHTRNHPILAALDLEEAKNEIASGKKDLEDIIRAPVTAFAYPNGRETTDFTMAHRNLLPELGFTTAVTTEPFVVSPASDTFRLPRFTPWDKTPTRFMMRLLHAFSRVA